MWADTKEHSGTTFRPRSTAARKAPSIRREAMPRPRSGARRLRMGEGHHAIGQAIIGEGGAAIGIEFETGQSGIVANIGTHAWSLGRRHCAPQGGAAIGLPNSNRR